ncbi:hypothetical protein QTP88_018358 [Uroleucon formosanum]
MSQYVVLQVFPQCGTRKSDGGFNSRLTHCPELVDRRNQQLRQVTPPQREMWQVNWPQWLLSRRTPNSADNVTQLPPAHFNPAEELFFRRAFSFTLDTSQAARLPSLIITHKHH